MCKYSSPVRLEIRAHKHTHTQRSGLYGLLCQVSPSGTAVTNMLLELPVDKCHEIDLFLVNVISHISQEWVGVGEGRVVSGTELFLSR